MGGFKCVFGASLLLHISTKLNHLAVASENAGPRMELQQAIVPDRGKAIHLEDEANDILLHIREVSYENDKEPIPHGFLPRTIKHAENAEASDTDTSMLKPKEQTKEEEDDEIGIDLNSPEYAANTKLSREEPPAMPRNDSELSGSVGSNYLHAVSGRESEPKRQLLGLLGLLRLKKLAKCEEEPGQKYIAKILQLAGLNYRIQTKIGRVQDFLGMGIDPSIYQQPIILSNGLDAIETTFVDVLQARDQYVDFLIRQPSSEWIGRMYREIPGRYLALESLERDFALTKLDQSDQPLAMFRHRYRFDIPIDLYNFSNYGNYVQSPAGELLLNAVARRPLIRATAEDIYCNARSGNIAYKALLSMSQQAVRAVANLNCAMQVHTNINPRVFLITQKGLVFLSGLMQTVKQGLPLPQTFRAMSLFTPPELRIAQKAQVLASPAQDAWQLGMTLLQFWCQGSPVESSLVVGFNGCHKAMPQEMQNLIVGLTNQDAKSRLLAEAVAWQHPAMMLPIVYGRQPSVDINQDDQPQTIFL